MFYTTRTIKEYEMRPGFTRTFHNTLNTQYGTFWGQQNNFFCTPDANVLELDDCYLLEVSLPGVVLDDVAIKAEQHYITVEAKRLPTRFEEEALIHLQEMPFTRLIRSFEFHMPIVSEQVEARMDRGILYVSVPKLEVAHRIPVTTGIIEGRLPGIKTQVTGKADSRNSTKETLVK